MKFRFIHHLHKKIIKILSICLLFAHICACLLIIVAYFQVNCTSIWIPEISEQAFHTSYVRALYLSIQTITTVGYGDNTPVNNFEYLVSFFMMVTGAYVYSFALSAFLNYFLDLGSV